MCPPLRNVLLQVIIDNLPKHTMYATTVRVAISIVIFLSYPLAFLNITVWFESRSMALLASGVTHTRCGLRWTRAHATCIHWTPFRAKGPWRVRVQPFWFSLA